MSSIESQGSPRGSVIGVHCSTFQQSFYKLESGTKSIHPVVIYFLPVGAT